MKSKRIGVVYCQESRNIGDDVQTLAMLDLIQRVNPAIETVLVEREKLNTEDVAKLDALIISGWFMHHPENWPPNNSKIFFISIHISAQYGAADVIQSEKFLEFYRKHEPIGCRDRGTMRKFQELGVGAYFSGCATLTLKSESSENDHRSGKIMAIDPFLKVNPSVDYQQWRLSQLVPASELKRCQITTNEFPEMPSRGIDLRLKTARNYIKEIDSASYVLTSRIHAALPSIALGKRVYFLDLGYDRNPLLRDRFDGIIELFSTITEDDFKYVGRSMWAKLIRATCMDRLIDSVSRHKILEGEDRINKKGLCEAEKIRRDIEASLRSFLESI